MKLRFCLLLPPKANKLAANTANAAASDHPRWVVVDSVARLPHITLFVMKFDKRKLDNVLGLVDKNIVRKKDKGFNLKIEGFETYDGIWLALKVKPSAKLNKFQKKIKEGVEDSVILDRKGMRPEKHVSLVKFKQKNLVYKIVKSLDPPVMTFKASTVALCLSDNHGQVYEILKKFRLK